MCQGLQFINQLRPVTYNVDLIKLNQFLKYGKTGMKQVHLKINASLEKISENR
jgi:hypothetical protein